MNTGNDWLGEILAAADRNGWMVTGYNAELPGSITLTDSRGVRVTIHDPRGAWMREYVGRFVAVPQEPKAK